MKKMENKFFKNKVKINNEVINDTYIMSSIIKDCELKCASLALESDCNNFSIRRRILMDTSKPITDEIYYNDDLRDRYVMLRKEDCSEYEFVILGWE